MAQHELQRRRGVRDHQVGAAVGELDADVFAERHLRRLRKLLVLQVLGVRVDLYGGVREQHLPQRRVEVHVSRERLRSAMNDQHLLDRRLRVRRRRLRQACHDRCGHEIRAQAKPAAHQNDSFATS